LEVLIGDSILASRDILGGLGAINEYLNEFPGQELNNYAKIGSSLHGGQVKSVPQLYQDMRTKTAPAVPSTIVLNGGGNDVSLCEMTAGSSMISAGFRLTVPWILRRI
jgi:hypothetical protein